MKARLIEFSREQGFGRVALPDGAALSFDCGVCPGGVPEVGAEVEIEVATGPRGPRVRRLSPIPTGATTSRQGLLARWGDPASCVCFDPDSRTPVEIYFRASSWPSGVIPRHGAPVLCLVPADHYSLAPGGWQGNAARSVEPIDLSSIPEDVLKILRSSLKPADERSFIQFAIPPPQLLVSMDPRPTRFAHLCDGGAALAENPPSGSCEVCGKQPGRLGVGESSGREIELACDGCVTAGRVEYVDAGSFDDYVRTAHPDWSDERRQELSRRLAGMINRVPPVVRQLQATDWPICSCSDEPTDYVGTPSGRASFVGFVGRGARRYEFGRVAAAGDIGRLAEGDPEEWREVCCFHCSRCGASYYTDQFT
jgi:hypothetical protein